jgi:hypothetical protein
VLARWKEHFEEHLNEGSESEQPTRPVDLRDDGIDIYLREEIEGALKYLKNKKASGGNLVDALHEVIQQAWTRHYRKTGLRGYCVQCTRRVINSILKTIEGFAF